VEREHALKNYTGQICEIFDFDQKVRTYTIKVALCRNDRAAILEGSFFRIPSCLPARVCS
jgi:hypothetical protein